MFQLALPAKIRSRLGLFARPGDFERLMENGDLGSLYKSICALPGFSDLSGIEDTAVTRVTIGRKLHERHIKMYCRFIPHATGPTKTLMIALVRKYDAENIKEILLGLSRSEKTNCVGIFSTGIYSHIDYTRLLESRTIEDAINTLKGSGYHGALMDAMPAYNDSKNSLILERMIDNRWWSIIERRCRLLGVFDSIPAATFLNIESEVFNINWIYRAKFLLGLAPEKIPPHLTENRSDQDSKFFEALISSQTPQAYYDQLRAGRHARILSKTTEGEISPTVFHVLCQRYLMKRLREMKALFPFSAMTAISLWKELELETANLETVCECIFYGKKKEDALKYIF
ncbi:MAG: hypothetical protein A2583_02555 [Bdellovibrionales bacterium RIFOXYD1_FULL_53_11]|nr:MAG: hypothetical protein A2583_02555 [Bdellovibrionales bacterium RIFOXYD1_FULL_53_11]